MNHMVGSGGFNHEVPPDVQTRRLRLQMGEEAFVNHVIEQGDGQGMYEALMRVTHYSTAARDRLLAAIAQSGHVEAIYLTYSAYRKGIPEKARTALIRAVIDKKDPGGAYNLLCGKHKLTTGQKKELLQIVATDSFYADCAHDYSAQITKEERSALLDAMKRFQGRESL